MTQLEDVERKYAFQVISKANKIDIKNAVEKKFDVEVQKVATMTCARNINGTKRKFLRS